MQKPQRKRARISRKEKERQRMEKRLKMDSNPFNDPEAEWTDDSSAAGTETGVVDLTGETTHVIFAIDFSSSMNNRDVRTSKGEMTRWDAVFECTHTFLTQQLQSSGDDDAASDCIVSVIIFNDEARVLLSRIPLLGDGSNVLKKLRAAKNKYMPVGGTGFSAGFGEAERLAAARPGDGVILVFLSDGRPGDLRTDPPPLKPIENMQTTFRRHGKTYLAAGVYIERMQKRHDVFSLQLICLYSEGVHVSIGFFAALDYGTVGALI